MTTNGAQELFTCDSCHYSTRHPGHWKRHLASARHARQSKSVCLVVKEEPDSTETLLRDTVRQLHDLLVAKDKDLREAQDEIYSLKKQINEAHSKNFVVSGNGGHVVQEVNNSVNNTFIFVLDDPCIGPDGLIGIMKRMHNKVEKEYGGVVGKSDVLILGLNDVKTNANVQRIKKDSAD